MIDLRRFSDHDVPDFGKFLRRLRRRCAVDFGLPGLYGVDDCLYVPAAQVGPRAYTGGLLDAEGLVLDAGNVVRRQRTLSSVAPVDAEAEAGEALYLGWMFDSYGPVLLESLARVWALDHVPALPVVFHLPVGERLPPFAVRFLNRLHIDPGRVMVPKVPTRFERLHVPEAALQIGDHAYRLQAATWRAMVEPGLAPDPRPLYVASERRVSGEGVLERLLDAEGFRILHPELMPVGGRIAAFHQHATIVGPIGAAMHNVVFSRAGSRVVYLVGMRPPSEFPLCDELADLQASYVQCLGEQDAALPAASAPQRLDIAAVLGALAREGLLRHMPDDVAALQRQVDAEHAAAVAQAHAAALTPPA